MLILPRELLQKRAVGLCQLLVIVRLKSQPTLTRYARLRVRICRLLVGDHDLLASTSSRSRVCQQLSMARLVKADEPESGLVDALTHCQETYVQISTRRDSERG